MDGDELLEKTKEKLKGRGFTTLRKTPATGLYLFFSFDLVNSTQFKTTYPDDWPVVVRRFYDFVAAEVTTRLTSAILWKYVGDEILFYKRVTIRKDIHECLPAIHDAVDTTIAHLHSSYSKTRELLSLKSAVWIALTEFIPPGDSAKVDPQTPNIIVPTGRHPESAERDFLGPDIDTGFRIAQFARRRRVAVSAHLAYLLYRERGTCKKIEEQLKIVSYEVLKGVWGGRRYPIIWFEKDWRLVKESFLYDEQFDSNVVAAIIRGTLADESNLNLIEKIFSDLGRDHEVEKLYQSLDSLAAATDEDLIEIEIPRGKYAEVHCVAVCFSPDGKVLIAKRPSTKKRYPDAYEFGCGQLEVGDSFADALKTAYRADFGIELNVPENPTPFRTFLIDDNTEHRQIPGIIFIAEVSNPAEVEARYLREKHSEIRWIDPEQFAEDGTSRYVPNFSETLCEAVSLWKANKHSRST
jgi:8-oxo-dGTP pyrophosphatase MutT (NUDIX family)